MALAHLSSLRRTEKDYIFKADAGSNLYFQFKIGEDIRYSNGLSFVEVQSYISPLFSVKRPKEQLLRTEFLLKVPVHLFSRKARYIQLFTYQNVKGRSPAISAIVTVLSYTNGNNTIGIKVPTSGLPIELNNMDNTIVQNKSFTYREPSLSRGMFWEGLLKNLPQILKVAGPIVQGLLKGKQKGGNSTPPTSDDGTAPATESDSSQILEAIAGLVQQITAKKDTAESMAFNDFGYNMAINPAMLAQLAPLLEKVISPETINAIGDQPVKLFKAIGDIVGKMNQREIEHLERLNPGVDNPNLMAILKSVDVEDDRSMEIAERKFVEAKVAPALLAALPALMPVIEKALDPKTINAIGDQPIKLLNAIGDVVGKRNKQEIEHLERLNPGVDNPNLMNILNSMSMSSQQGKGIIFRYEPKLDIDFVQVATVLFQGRKKVLYSKSKAAFFPIQIKTKHPNPPDKPFEKVIVQLLVQDSDTMETLVQKKFQLKNISLGDVIQDIFLSTEEMIHLPVNKDLKVEVSFIWKSKKGNTNTGAFKNHYITLTDAYVFDQMGEQKGEATLMNDIVAHRSVWHKVWEGGFTKSKRWYIDFDLKYFYALTIDEAEPGRLETKQLKLEDNATGLDEEPYRRKVRYKLKSGMEHTVALLNGLLPDLGLPKLSTDQLNALQTTTFQQIYQQAARIALEFRGESGQTATLWTYPEIVTHELVLKKVGNTNSLGQVTTFEEERVLFPRPSTIHFIGTTSK